MTKILKKLRIPVWLVVILFGTLVFRIPSLFEPYSYGDEMIYVTLGHGIRNGLTLYKDIYDNKPPLLYYLAAIAGNLFWFKALLMFWSLVTIIFFWKLTQMLFAHLKDGKREKAQQAATGIFALLTTIPLLEGNIANAENFYIGFIIAAIFVVLRYRNTWGLFLSGILFSIATLFKVPAIFDLGVILFVLVLKLKFKTKDVLQSAKKICIVMLGVSVPIMVTFAWFYIQGAVDDYLRTAFLQNIGYLSAFRPSDVQKSFFVRNAPLLIRAGIVVGVFIVLFIKRKRLSKPFIIATAWLVTSLFAITLSERPYPHYLLQAAAPVAILITILVTFETSEQTLVVMPIFFLLSAIVFYKFYYYSTASYYNRFVNFALGVSNQEKYFSEFDGNVNRNYKIAKYINKSVSSHGNIFVWGDASPIYALTGHLPPFKYVANYHISDFSNKTEVVSALTLHKPEYIVMLPNSEPFMEINKLLNPNYVVVNEIDGAMIWRLMSDTIVRIWF